jgi:hypothetical protein
MLSEWVRYTNIRNLQISFKGTKMLTLYGFDVSNYFNMIKLALAIKGIEYKTVILYPNQSDDYLTKSPMGKVATLESEQDVLTETNLNQREDVMKIAKDRKLANTQFKKYIASLS